MSALHRNPKIDFGRSRVASTAVLALNGAQSVDLGAVDRWARQHSGTTLNVAVDGGVRCWQARRRRVDLFVGDGDSAFPPAAGETILLPQDKPISDLGAALDRLLARRIRQFAIAGLWGGRFDHEWINLAECARVAPQCNGILGSGKRGWMAMTSKRCRVVTRPGEHFSLLALEKGTRVTLSGARWELNGETIEPGSRGLSNVSGRELSLRVERGVAALLFPSGNR